MQLENETNGETLASFGLADPDVITRLIDAIPPHTLSGWETQLLEKAADQLADIKDWSSQSFHLTIAERSRLASLVQIYLGETLEVIV
jgi:hypothetical protein